MKVNTSPFWRAYWHGPPRELRSWAFAAADGRGKPIDGAHVIWSPAGLRLDEAVAWLQGEKPDLVEVLVLPVTSSIPSDRVDP